MPQHSQSVCQELRFDNPAPTFTSHHFKQAYRVPFSQSCQIHVWPPSLHSPFEAMMTLDVHYGLLISA